MSTQENLSLLFNLFEDNIFEEVTVDGTASTSNREALSELDIAFLPERIENFAGPAAKRFKSVTDSELEELKEKRQSTSTKKNTKWGVKLFQEWSLESLGTDTDFTTISCSDLDKRLGQFYAEATPKPSESRSKQMSAEQATEYTNNSYKSIRSAINRHLQDLGRDMDIVRGKEFRNSNKILDGKLKKNLEEGLSRPTQHKEVITNKEMEVISTYLFGEVNPVILRFRIWFILAIQFVSRGLEFHQQLKTTSFVFKSDENGNRYATLSHDTKQKNWQGGIDASENPKEKRMYAVPSAGNNCPVESLLLFLSKTDPDATSLFNCCTKPALANLVLLHKTDAFHVHFQHFLSDIFIFYLLPKHLKRKLKVTHLLRP